MSQRQRKVSYWQDAPMPRDQLALFATTLEDRIPEDHPVRLLDEIMSRMDWTEWEASYHGAMGQPPIHPQLLASVLLFAMIRRIRSSRQIEYQIKHSIDFMWLVSGRTITHNTICEFRRDHGDKLKGIYRQLVRLAVDMGVAKLSELCIDGSRILANANRYKTWTADRVNKVIESLDAELKGALDKMETADEADDLLDDGTSADKLPDSLADIQLRKEKLEEILAQLNAMDEHREANGIDAKKNPAQLPKTDPDARILPNKEGGYAANYTPVAVTETQHGFIVGADVVIGNVEHDQLLPMVDDIMATYETEIATMMGDTAYSAGDNLSGMEQRDIELLAPLAEPKCPENPAIRDDLTQPVPEDQLDDLPINPQTKRFDKTAFVYDEETDSYYCPAGKKLPRSGSEQKKTRGGTTTRQINYTCYDCAGCPLADRCRKDPAAKKGRKITHDLHEPARRRHRTRMQDTSNRERYKTRQHIAETPFAVLKATMDLRRFLLRSIAGVQREFLWGCTAFNLKKLMTMTDRLRAYFAAESNPEEIVAI